jgi:hypothetical protein
MALHCVPIPPNAVRDTAHAWVPFVERIEKRNGEYPGVLVEQVNAGDVHVVVAWDDRAQEAKALAGIRILTLGDKRVAEIIWMTGQGRDEWVGLMPDLLRYLKELQRCDRVRAIARPGWSRALKADGFRTTHMVFERDL